MRLNQSYEAGVDSLIKESRRARSTVSRSRTALKWRCHGQASHGKQTTRPAATPQGEEPTPGRVVRRPR